MGKNEFARAYLGDISSRNPEASPLFADLADLPPVLFQVGSTELLLDDSRSAHAAILAAGGWSELEIYDDVPHGWQMLDPLIPESQRALLSAAGFITSHVALSPHDTRIS